MRALALVSITSNVLFTAKGTEEWRNNMYQMTSVNKVAGYDSFIINQTKIMFVLKSFFSRICKFVFLFIFEPAFIFF